MVYALTPSFRSIEHDSWNRSFRLRYEIVRKPPPQTRTDLRGSQLLKPDSKGTKDADSEHLRGKVCQYVRVWTPSSR